MSAKLNKKKRQKILHIAIVKKFQKPLDIINEEKKALGDRVTCKVYPQKIQKWLDEAPEGGVPQFEFIELYGERNTLLSMITVKEFRIMYTDLYKTPKYRLTSSEEKELKALQKRESLIIEQKTKFKKLISSALESCTTTKQLHLQYPDIAKHLPDVAKNFGKLVVRNEDVVAAFKEPVPKLEDV